MFEDRRKGPSEPGNGHSMMNDGDLAAVPIGVIHEEFVLQNENNQVTTKAIWLLSTQEDTMIHVRRWQRIDRGRLPQLYQETKSRH